MEIECRLAACDDPDCEAAERCLFLEPGEYLQQDNGAEAARILGHRR